MGAPELLALSLGLSVVVAALGWAGGRLVERLSADPRLRDRVWATALALPALPPLAVGLMLLTPAPVRAIAAAPAGLPTERVMAPVEAVAVAPAALAFDPTVAAWAVLGMATLLAVGRSAGLALRARRLLRIVRQAQAADAAVTAMVEAAARDLGLRPPRVGVSDAAAEALLASLGRVRLILPADLMAPTTDPASAKAVIAHELAHLKRGDHLALWLEEALLALLAVNPLMPALRAPRAAAREEACDALALSGASPDARRAYARSLIEALRSRAAPPASGGLPALTFTGAGRTTAMRRLRAVMNPAPAAGRGPRLTALGLAGVIVALAGAGSLAVAGEREAVVRMAPARPVPPAAVDEQFHAGDEAARTALTPGQQGRYRSPTGRQYQALCASRDPGDDGFCAGVMLSVLQNAERFGVCPPATLDQGDPSARQTALGALVDRGKAEIAQGAVRPDDAAFDVARAALARAYPCVVPTAVASPARVDARPVFLPVDLELGGAAPDLAPGEQIRVALIDERQTVIAESLTTRASRGPTPRVDVALTDQEFPPLNGPSRAYTLTGEIRAADGTVRYRAEPATIRLAPGSRGTARNLSASLFFRPV